jgi:hypothetical protein
LAKVPTLIEQATMSADPEEEDVLFANFDQALDTPPLQVTLDDMVQMDVEADIACINQPRTASPLTWQDLEKWFITSPTLKQAGIIFEQKGDRQWLLEKQQHSYSITFDPKTFDEHSSLLRLLTLGDPLFDDLKNIMIR